MFVRCIRVLLQRRSHYARRTCSQHRRIIRFRGDPTRLAQGQSSKPKAEVVERDARGKAIKVKIGDTVYDVCREGKYDSCINPREAGLNYGNRPLNRWPGKPASEIPGPKKQN